jgi:hypothetical protein
MLKFWTVAAALALLTAMALVWGILDAGARRQAAKADALRARAEVIHARKQGRQQIFQWHILHPIAKSYPAEFDQDDDTALQSVETAATSGETIAPQDTTMLEQIGFYTAAIGIAGLILLCPSLIWPRVKADLAAAGPAAAAATNVASKAIDFADEAAAGAAIGSLALVFKARGDSEGLALCSQLWSRAMQWPKGDAKP